MKLFSVQKKKVWDVLSKGQTVVCNPVYSMAYKTPKFREAYDFMVDAMKQRITHPDFPAIYPIWGWTNIEKERVLSLQYGEKGESLCLLTLDIPDDDLLLSDFYAWDKILQGRFLSRFDDPDLRIMEQRFLPILPDDYKKQIIRDSWDRMFSVDSQHSVIQATFWGIKPEYVQDVEFFTEQRSYFANRGHQSNRGHQFINVSY